MSYQVLARKWRPANFREMVGQEHVLKALVNALDHDRLHHAYLFTGTRGVGKTTIARILAKCLNCESGVSSEPCGTCSSCTEIAEGRSVDLLEVDAASRTKVEDTRELLENVQYAPTHARFKVYLIDEVHMLSNHSFNALLKTLEEPPPHVKFLLATTDPQKLPATVLSRCLQFNLKNMPPEQVVGHLKNILEKEMISFEEPALWLLGRAAAGSMRDALSLTDQAVAFGSGALREEEVRSMLGTVDLSFVYRLLEAAGQGDPAALLQVVAQMSEHATDFEGSLDELLSLLHRVAVAQVVPGAIDNSWGDAERIAELAGAISAEDAQLFYQIALNGKRDLPVAPDPRAGFEMIVLRMVAFRPAAVIDDSIGPQDIQSVSTAGEGGEVVKKPVDAPRAETAPAPSVSAPAPASEPEPEAEPEPAPLREPSPRVEPVAPAPTGKAAKGVDSAVVALDSFTPEKWPQVFDQLGLVGQLQFVAAHCVLDGRSGPELSFVLDGGNAALFKEAHAQQLEAALGVYFECELKVTIEPGEPAGETPAMRDARRARERQQEAVDAIESDRQLQALISHFDAELDRASIAPTDTQ
jgi:DNA polymerase-3 subunit gamma/tau